MALNPSEQQQFGTAGIEEVNLAYDPCCRKAGP